VRFFTQDTAVFLPAVKNSENNLRVYSEKQKRCGTSKIEMGFVKSEQARGLILERKKINKKKRRG
jgi:hypothetical protein